MIAKQPKSQNTHRSANDCGETCPNTAGRGMSRAIAVIPARGGSKRIPGKNTRSFLGKPLLAHTIEAALDSDLFEEVHVSTDSEDVADIAAGYQRTTVSIRPAALSDDFSTAVDVTVHVIRSTGKSDWVAQLLPTSPLRTAADLVASYESFSDSPERSLISVGEMVGYNPWWTCTTSDDRLKFLNQDALASRSQDLAPVACPTGAFAWASVAGLRRTASFYGLDPRPFLLPFARGIDIDNENDWAIAERLGHR